MNGWHKTDDDRMQQIFERYHSAKHIEPTDAFVAQACYDIGWLQGCVVTLLQDRKELMSKLSDELNPK